MFPAAVISLAVIYSSTESGFVSRTIQFIMFVVALTVAASHKGIEQPFVHPSSRTDGAEATPLAYASP